MELTKIHYQQCKYFCISPYGYYACTNPSNLEAMCCRRDDCIYLLRIFASRTCNS